MPRERISLSIDLEGYKTRITPAAWPSVLIWSHPIPGVYVEVMPERIESQPRPPGYHTALGTGDEKSDLGVIVIELNQYRRAFVVPKYTYDVRLSCFT